MVTGYLCASVGEFVQEVVHAHVLNMYGYWVSMCICWLMCTRGCTCKCSKYEWLLGIYVHLLVNLYKRLHIQMFCVDGLEDNRVLSLSKQR